MTLTAYRIKRNFKATPEPRGKAASRAGQLRFVVQKHAATSLHYDFRLELDGVLKSWAVPKGPSLDPTRKALAIEVEDHPIDYANFEGEIPAGQYGAGQVIVWDRGLWMPDGDPHAGLAKGHLKFSLNGKKLHGSWSLVRMRRSGNRNQWLLMKHDDEHARPESKYNIITAEPRSVLSRRTIEARTPRSRARVRAPRVRAAVPLSSGSNGRRPAKKSARMQTKRSTPTGRLNPEEIDGARAAPMPASLRPQLATLVDSPPQGPDWVHEVKFDGYRLLAFKDGEKTRLITRNGLDWTHRFRPIADEVAKLHVDSAIFDGEVVALDEHGTPRFQQLQNVGKTGSSARLVYFLFDLPYCDGWDLIHTRLLDRKTLLKQVLAEAPSNILRYSEHFTEPGSDLLQLLCSRQLEGIISKRADAPYHQRRTRDWVKSKCSLSQEMLIGGYTPPKRSRVGFGSLLVGCHDRHGRLLYRGRVGAGFDRPSLRSMHDRLRKLHRDDSPFDTAPPRDVTRGVKWVEPKIVIEATFHELTDDGRVRQGVFRGIREDKPAREVVCETPLTTRAPPPATKDSAMPSKTVRSPKINSGAADSPGRTAAPSRRAKQSRVDNQRITVAGVSISHPDAVLFPQSDITKLDLARYYDTVAELMLPHVIDRPLMLLRCPDSASGECFHQKHVTPGFPPAIDSVPIREKDKTERTIVIHDRAGLISLAQVRALEIHGWGAPAENPDAADRLVFDLDPGPGVAWPDLVAAAVLLRKMLLKLDLESFVKTSGSKGLHVVIPLNPAVGWDVAKPFTRAVAERLAADHPDQYVSRMDKSLRKGRIFVDYLRNGRGATCVSAFSVRARAGAPISAPVAWSSLPRLAGANVFTVADAAKHFKSFRAAWSGYAALKQSLPKNVRATSENRTGGRRESIAV